MVIFLYNLYSFAWIQHFCTPPHYSGGVIWYHGCPCVCLSVHSSVISTCVFSVPDDNSSRYQWIFTKLGVCISIVDLWFGIANGQISSVFDSYLHVTCPYFHFRTITWVRGSCKKFCHWVRITSVLRFIKHIFITNFQSIPPLLKRIFVTFLPSRKKQINSLLLVSVGDTDK